MADNSKIEWTDATWNPITGCSVVSPGCTNCYAMKLAGTRLQHHESRAGLTIDTKAGPVWNGQVRFNEEWLSQPARWRKPRMIFVCAHGDLFHESVPESWIDRVFRQMLRDPRHTFQVLTKRATRMRAYMACFKPDGDGWVTRDGKPAMGEKQTGPLFVEKNFPPKHIWFGVSAEDQERAEERIPDLLATPAAVRFVSYEPALGPLDFTRIDTPISGPGSNAPASPPSFRRINALKGYSTNVDHKGYGRGLDGGPHLHWIIAGGESGAGARPSHPDWFRSMRDQCARAGVPFFFKQWGEYRPEARHGLPGDGIVEMRGANANVYWPNGTIGAGHANDKGGIGYHLERVGKKVAGALLDGREHREFPR
jgi:protein gp37